MLKAACSLTFGTLSKNSELSCPARTGQGDATGRAINPVTKTNWEGTGVEPHVSVAADKALDVAIVEARKAAEAWRQTKTSPLTIWNDVQEQLRAANDSFQDGKTETATKTLRAALKKGLDSDVLNEDMINMLGYDRLQSSSLGDAIAIFRFNADNFPESANVWDSLAEAYMKNGQLDLAVEHYKTSLELDPANMNAKEMIDQLKQKTPGD